MNRKHLDDMSGNRDTGHSRALHHASTRPQVFLSPVTLYEGEHEAILSQKLWERVQRKLAENASHGGAGVKNKYGYLLRV